MFVEPALGGELVDRLGLGLVVAVGADAIGSGGVEGHQHDVGQVGARSGRVRLLRGVRRAAAADESQHGEEGGGLHGSSEKGISWSSERVGARFGAGPAGPRARWRRPGSPRARARYHADARYSASSGLGCSPRVAAAPVRSPRSTWARARTATASGESTPVMMRRSRMSTAFSGYPCRRTASAAEGDRALVGGRDAQRRGQRSLCRDGIAQVEPDHAFDQLRLVAGGLGAADGVLLVELPEREPRIALAVVDGPPGPRDERHVLPRLRGPRPARARARTWRCRPCAVRAWRTGTRRSRGRSAASPILRRRRAHGCRRHRPRGTAPRSSLLWRSSTSVPRTAARSVRARPQRPINARARARPSLAMFESGLASSTSRKCWAARRY